MSDDKPDKKDGIHVWSTVIDTPIGKAIIGEAHLASDCPSATKRAEVDKKGPSRVVSEAYRSGYDRIFGTKPERGSA